MDEDGQAAAGRGGSTASGDSSMVRKETRVAGSSRVRVRDLSETATLEATLYLRRKPSSTSLSSLSSLGAALPPQRRYLSRDEVADRFGADPADVTVVSEWAARNGFTLVSSDLARRAIVIRGAAAGWNRSFGVVLGRYSFGGATYIGHEGAPALPPELGEAVVAVLGLDSRPAVRTHFRIAAAGTSGYPPALVGDAYEFPAPQTGAGQTIALLEFGGGYAASDLATFFQRAGVPLPSVTAVSVDGASNAPTGDPSGPDAEVELDIEIAGALAPGAALVVYFAPNTEQGFVDAISAAVHDTTHTPSIISVSWGGPEPSWSSAALTAFNQNAEDAAAIGVTVLAAAGDSGASDGESGGTLAVDFPASAPYVLGCGGTRLLLSGATITEEVVWNDLAEGEGATGGGVSQVFPLPSYQSGAGVPTGEGGFAGRGVPDVAGDADPDTGFAVFVDGSGAVIGGTSAVAPLWAALVARLNQALGNSVGFLQPLLYTSPEEATFHDITEGNNAGFDAGPGWDACTGWGSPDGAALLAALRGSGA